MWGIMLMAAQEIICSISYIIKENYYYIIKTRIKDNMDNLISAEISL